MRWKHAFDGNDGGGFTGAGGRRDLISGRKGGCHDNTVAHQIIVISAFSTAQSRCGNNDSLSVGFSTTFGTGIRVLNIDARQRRDVMDIEFRGCRMTPGRRVEKLDAMAGND